MNKLLQMHDLKFKTLLFFLTFNATTLFAQNTKTVKKELLTVSTLEEAKEFRQAHQELRSKIYVYNQVKHTNSLSKELFKHAVGDVFTIDEKNTKAIYKVISIVPKKHYRANYIYFSGKKMTPEAIHFLRSEIAIEVRKGKEFKEFAYKHSMDRNAKSGGDIGWFTEKYMSEEFMEALRKHPVNTVYNLDLPEQHKYYLVQQTESPKNINLLTVLKVTL